MKIPSSRLLTIAIIIFMLLQIPLKCTSQFWYAAEANPIELGLVRWERNYNIAIQRSKVEKKPVFMFFQEVPGCSTCSTYGREVMSHPLIVEAIETYFIPLCIYNNKKGEDARILEKYQEPSWNNPVVRIIDANGKDIINRVSSNYSIGVLTDAVIRVLHKIKINTPEYLSILHTESNSYETDEVVLGMYCFWTGEKAMATISGVRETEAGFMGGKEVVRVRFDPEIISVEDLVSKAKRANCADVVFDNDQIGLDVVMRKKENFRKDTQTKYYLFNSKYRTIPMTPLQSLRVNYELSQNGNPEYLLSPRQIALMQKSKKNYIGKDLIEGWREIGW